MSKKNYRSPEKYKEAKRIEYARYYKSTQYVGRRRWTPYEQSLFIHLRTCLTNTQISKILHRSCKALEHRTRLLRKTGVLPLLESKRR